MKIAIPTREKFVDDHFGHCEYYTIANVSDDNKIEKFEIFEAPQGCGCKSNIASILADMGVLVMLAGNMGAGAISKVETAGIKVFRGCSGPAEDVAQDYLDEKIVDSGVTCGQNDRNGHHHNHAHQCAH